MDNHINIEGNLIYLNPKYIDAYNNYNNQTFNLNRYLDAFIKFQSVRRLNYDVADKSMYHILRVRGLIDHYIKYGKYEMIVEEPWCSSMLVFKENYDKGITYIPLIKEALNYISNFKKKE